MAFDEIPSIVHALIAIGGNQGDVPQTVHRTLEALKQHPEIQLTRTSLLRETRPVGGVTRGTFWNGCFEIATSLGAPALLQLTQTLEQQAGRLPGQRWDSRPLDLDLITYGDRIIHTPELKIPHPACWYRRFVLDPLVEIAPETIHPRRQVSFRHLRDQLLVRPLPVLLVKEAKGTPEPLNSLLKNSRLRVSHVPPGEALPAPPPALAFFMQRERIVLPPEADPYFPWVDGSELPGLWTQQVQSVLEAALGESLE